MNIFLNRPLRTAAGLSALVTAIGFASAAFAQNDSIYGEAYQKLESVVPEQAQIVMFRGTDNDKQAAHVYLDGELQTALMPGGYTTFCVAAGEHSLEDYIGDAPQYRGKRNPRSFAKFQGGKTYVLEVPTGANQNTPIVHSGKEAQQSLQGLRRQIHVISRASSVLPCQTETKLSLRSDVLFDFGKGGYNDLTAEGRAQLNLIVRDIQQRQQGIQSIEVIGYADPLGQFAANQRLSQQRAETIRRMLLEQGIQSDLVNASGRGSAEPVVSCHEGSRRKQIACNAPNRRVELLIRGTQGKA
ncbi:OmpA family protein [Pseudomonas sp. C9-3]|uniref:OmpA family protein n=1 Tax=Pseudomonas sp. C9-3 TaxID=3078264 RepID=UPI0028E940F9|nr:OmpA family protein [Pseudomonas sp. C9-3]